MVEPQDQRDPIDDLIDRAINKVSREPAEYRPQLASTLLAHWLHEKNEATTSPSGSREVGQSKPKERSLNEAFARLGRRSQPEQLVAIAAYRMQSGSLETLTKDDFLAAYHELRLPPPQNFSEQIGRCVRRAWLGRGADRDSAQTWRVTQTGLTELAGWEPATQE